LDIQSPIAGVIEDEDRIYLQTILWRNRVDGFGQGLGEFFIVVLQEVPGERPQFGVRGVDVAGGDGIGESIGSSDAAAGGTVAADDQDAFVLEVVRGGEVGERGVRLDELGCVYFDGERLGETLNSFRLGFPSSVGEEDEGNAIGSEQIQCL
jgi:hypothetical protein